MSDVLLFILRYSYVFVHRRAPCMVPIAKLNARSNIESVVRTLAHSGLATDSSLSVFLYFSFVRSQCGSIGFFWFRAAGPP